MLSCSSCRLSVCKLQYTTFSVTVQTIAASNERKIATSAKYECARSAFTDCCRRETSTRYIIKSAPPPHSHTHTHAAGNSINDLVAFHGQTAPIFSLSTIHICVEKSESYINLVSNTTVQMKLLPPRIYRAIISSGCK